MENLFSRHRNATVLVIALFVQIIGLASQVKTTQEGRSVRLIRAWTLSVFTPVEKAVVNSGHGVRHLWSGYLDLHHVHQENGDLRRQIEQMKIERARLESDAAQAHRLQALLGFKEQYISQTVAAQVIGSSGTENSRVITIDKGASDGIRKDMPVITPDGVVGKVAQVSSGSSQVLLITDPSWGVGALLEKSRLQGIVKGTPSGEDRLQNILSDEKVEVGERVLTSGGDGIFPKGLPLGTISEILPRTDIWLNVAVKPAANLYQLEEVLIITKVVQAAPTSSDQDRAGPIRAADVLAQRLPSVPPKTDKADPKAPKTTTPELATPKPPQGKPLPTKPEVAETPKAVTKPKPEDPQ
jgi:rod shape-determining protein MreC